MSALEKSPTAGVTLPPALAGFGISVVEKNGVRGVNLPPELFQSFNVVSPTTQIAALDPMWSPAIRLIHLDPNTHGYPNADKRGETAIAKNGILALADGAGIQISTKRMGRNELRDFEIGWAATAFVRQPDGTLKPIEESKVINLNYEEEAILLSCGGDQNKARAQWFKKRVHLDALCETKAMLRAIRAAMQLRHSLPTGEFARPWLVIGVTFTPDLADGVVRQQVIDRAMGSAQQLYGGDSPLAALPAGDFADDEPAEFVEGHVVDEPQAPAPTAPSAPVQAPAVEDAGGDDGYDEWRAQQEAAAVPADAGATSSWQAIIDAAGPTQIQFGKMKGLCIGDAFAADASYLQWLIGSQFTPKTPDQERAKAHARDYLQAAAALGMVGGTGERS